MKPYYCDNAVTLYHGDALAVAAELPDAAVDCIVTSPPYFGLRDYGTEGQYGLEASPAEYVETMRALFLELRRVLADDGTLWLNIGDSYIGGANSGGANQNDGGPAVRIKGLPPKRGLPAKNLLGIPWRVAFALQDDGWILRNAIIWNKPNAMPESVTDRLSGRYEMVFMLSKKPRYWFDLDPIREAPTDRKVHPSAAVSKASDPWGRNTGLAIHTGTRLTHENGRNPGDVWNINTQPFSGQIRNARLHPDHHGPDGLAYGKQRITSPDCPQHGLADRQGSSASDDGREALLSNRTSDTDTHRGQEQLGDSAATPTIGEPSSAPDSSGSQHRLNESSATPHSKRGNDQEWTDD